MNNNTEVNLRKLSLMIEWDKKIRKSKSKTKKNLGSNDHLGFQQEIAEINLDSKDFDDFYKKYTDKDKYRLGEWSFEVIDEIIILIEQAQVNK